MCGIAGLGNKEGEWVSQSQVRVLASCMEHRGPDAEGVFTDKNFGLAFRRLKIIDLSDTANQPMFNEDGKVAIVFNGEIYNFKELRADLEKAGHKFKTHSDTEVIVHAYEEWGTDCFIKFNGMFGIGILDLRQTKPILILARDRFGIKPLFYSIDQGRIAFASELKPLLQIPWIQKRVDPRTLLYFLKFSHVPTPDSILKGVRQLRPGQWLRFQNGEAEKFIYFDSIELSSNPFVNETTLATTPEEDALVKLDQTLQRVVSRQIVSDVPVGCFLSGGIDSSLLTIAYASLDETAGRPIKTFTIGYKEKEFDEATFAHEIATAFKTDHHELILKPNDLFDTVRDLPKFFDQPFADPTALPTVLLARFAKQKVTVALSGDGGDELFFGYPHQRGILLLNWLNSIPWIFRKAGFGTADAFLKFFTRTPLNHKLIHQTRKMFDILQFKDEGQFYQNFVGTWGPLQMSHLATLLQTPVDLSKSIYSEIIENIDELPLEEKISQIFIKTFLLDTVLAKTDRAGMAVGLEARVPFLDNEMAELSSKTPFHLKYKNGQSKYLLRKLLERKLKNKGLPTSLSSRKKQGFSIPMRDWLRGDLKYLLDDYLDDVRLRREGVFQPKVVQKLVREHVENRANHSQLLWSLLMFQLWKEHYSIS